MAWQAAVPFKATTMKAKPDIVKKVLAGFVFLFLLASCAHETRFVTPKVELMNLNVKDVTFSHINYTANIRLYNPNLEALHVNFMDYTLYVNGIKLIDGAEQVDKKVGPHEEAVVPVRLSGSVLNVIRLVSSMQNAHQVDFEMKGIVSGNDNAGRAFSLPFKEKGKLDLSSLNPGLPLR